MYDGATTCLGPFGVNIPIKRGVKQGDPLSPLLFNLVLDPLLSRLGQSPEGFGLGNVRLSCMAYADDLALFSSSPESMGRLLEITADYLSSVGMALSATRWQESRFLPPPPGGRLGFGPWSACCAGRAHSFTGGGGGILLSRSCLHSCTGVFQSRTSRRPHRLGPASEKIADEAAPEGDARHAVCRSFASSSPDD